MNERKDDILIRTGKVFSPLEGFIDDASIVVREGVVHQVVEGEIVSSSRKIIDLSGYTVSPLFCDHHIHFFRAHLLAADDIRDTLLRSGIACADENGDRNLSGIKMRDSLRGSITVRTAGLALYRKGGYGRSLGRGIDTVKEARETVDALSTMEADFIKVMNSGIFNPATGTITGGGFQGDDLRDIVSYANDKGLNVVCHANGDNRIRDAILAGVSTIVHGFGISDDSFSLMKERDVAFVPTVHALNRLKSTVDRGGKTRVEEEVEKHLAAVKKASDMGVRVFAGSDAGSALLPYGSSFYEEMKCLRKAGMTTEQVLSSAVERPFTRGDAMQCIVLDGLEPLKLILDGNDFLL